MDGTVRGTTYTGARLKLFVKNSTSIQRIIWACSGDPFAALFSLYTTTFRTSIIVSSRKTLFQSSCVNSHSGLWIATYGTDFSEDMPMLVSRSLRPHYLWLILTTSLAIYIYTTPLVFLAAARLSLISKEISRTPEIYQDTWIPRPQKRRPFYQFFVHGPRPVSPEPASDTDSDTKPGKSPASQYQERWNLQSSRWSKKG